MTMNDPVAAFDALRQQVETRLDALVPEAGAPSLAARHSLLAGGKRLRAVLTLLSARIFGVDQNDALDFACAVEMVHTASLMFDDLPAMDDAKLRRGVATAHVVYGDGVAILGGIGLLNAAYEVVAQATGDEAVRVRIVSILAEAIGWQGLVEGQAMDLAADDEAARLEDIQDGKTGALFVAAVRTGAALGQQDTSRRSPLVAYARSLGRAYQAFDDVIDRVAPSIVTGKTASRDEGKITALAAGGARRSVSDAVAQAEDRISEAIAALDAIDEDTDALAIFAEAIRHHFRHSIAA